MYIEVVLTSKCYKKQFPIIKWNSSHIIINKNHIQIYLNTHKIADFSVGSKDWKDRLSKIPARPESYGTQNKGHICLQARQQVVLWFRNIKIKELSN